MSAFIAGGQPVECGATVYTWHEHGLWFPALPKRSITRLVVAHWTGGSGRAPQVFQTLRQRNLSVHFCINPDGSIYQYADTDVRAAHAGSLDDGDHDGHQLSANAESIGIEMVNAALPEPHPGDPPREVMLETIHGHDVRYTGFTIAQTTAALHLIDALCRRYGLLMRVPMDGEGVLPTVMSEPAFRGFSGVCGHFQLTERKLDPGLAFLRAVRALPVRGFGAAE